MTLSSVDFPHPLGPRIAANSPSRSVRSTFRSAMTSWCPPKTFPAPLMSTAKADMAPTSLASDIFPGENTRLDSDNGPVGEKTQEPDRDHVGDYNFHTRDVVRVPQDITDSSLDRDHLGNDEDCPAIADAETHA